MRHLLPPGLIAYAEMRAAEIGVSGDRVLIASNTLSEEAYVAALADRAKVAFEPLDDIRRDACPLPDEKLIEAATVGLLPLTIDGESIVVAAPRLVDSRRLCTVLGAHPALAQRVRITSVARLQRFVTRYGSGGIALRAVEKLRDTHPGLSAGAGRPRGAPLAIAAGIFALSFAIAPAFTWVSVQVLLTSVFVAWTSLRFLGLVSQSFARGAPAKIANDSQLPVYSIIVPLYREAASVADLLAAMRGLRYPVKKLDIKLVLEADDTETPSALDRMELGPPFEIVIAPSSGPRTKPKALNAALLFARGAFVAVYDAEDRPEPDQLRLALDAFTAGDERLACVQARLSINNPTDSWLSRMFTAEYAGLFDVLLPGLAAWKLPLPLGGSSNHFRAPILRQVGAWDPFNVTEDADLGMRLARFGYGTAVIASTTHEEAPWKFTPWFRQRTRWLKGWIQTWLVHMRTPRKLARELGWPGFAAFQLLVGGTVLAALVHPAFVAMFALQLLLNPTSSFLLSAMSDLYGASVIAGYFISALLGLIGLMRRRRLGCAWALLFMPVYWLLLSFAAWRALFQFIRDPYRWEKTEHGTPRYPERERLACASLGPKGSQLPGS